MFQKFFTDLFLGTKLQSSLVPVSIITVWGAGQVELSKHQGEAVLAEGATLSYAVRSSDRPVGGDQGGSATSRVGPITWSKAHGHDPGVFSSLEIHLKSFRIVMRNTCRRLFTTNNTCCSFHTTLASSCRCWRSWSCFTTRVGGQGGSQVNTKPGKGAPAAIATCARSCWWWNVRDADGVEDGVDHPQGVVRLDFRQTSRKT